MDGKDKFYDIDGLVDWLPTGQISRSAEALNEWRSCEQVDNGDPSTSPLFWETDEESDDEFKPSDMFVKFTWNIENFSQLGKKELKSEIFEVNGYKWYILIYPQGCDVCNHLSLFLCVANHTQLLPGWGHFAQFTLAVLNKDPRKHKYSDTLHRFCKKEHDWGWKKFIELSKVQEGFLVDDTLTVKAQVQIIRNKPHRPFRCLDRQYRRALLGMYLSHVEQVCRKFVEDQKSKLRKLLKDKARWSSFCAFWSGLDQSTKLQMSCERAEVLFKVVVKHFFVEKEVTSALVMDSLYSGLKALRMESKCKGRKQNGLESMTNSKPIVYVDGDMFVLADDLLSLLEKSPRQSVASKDDKESSNQSKAGSSGHDFAKDSPEWGEMRLTEFGRRTIEIFVLSHIFSQKIEVAYQEAVAARIQEELIREEEEEREAEIEQRAKRQAADKEKRLKKKMNKQKRSRNGKGHRKDEKDDLATVDHEDYTEISEEAVGVSGKSTLQSVVEILNHSEGEADLRDNDDDDASVWLTTEDIDGSPATEDSTISDTCLSGESSTTEQGFPCFNDSMSSTPVDGVQPLELNVWDKDSTSDNGSWNVLVRKKSQRHKVVSRQSKRAAETCSDIAVNTNESRGGVARSSAFLSAHPEQTLDGSMKNHAQKLSYVDKNSTRQEGIEGPSEQSSVLDASNVRVLTNHLNSNMNPDIRRNDIQIQNSVATKIPTVQSSSVSSLKNGNGDIPRQRLEKANVKPLPNLSPKSLLDPVSRINSRPPSINQVVVAPKVGAPGIFQASKSEQLPSQAASPSPVPQLLNNLNMPKPQAASRPSSNGSVGDFNVQRSRTPPVVLPVENSENDLVTGLTFGSLTPEVLLGPSQLTDASFAGSPRFLPAAQSNDSSSLDHFDLTSRTIGLIAGSTSELPARTIPSQTSKAPLDDFPHIDIINYLLDEEIENGQALTGAYARVTAFGGIPTEGGAYELPQFPYIPGYNSLRQQRDNNYANGMYGDRQDEFRVHGNGRTDKTTI